MPPFWYLPKPPSAFTWHVFFLMGIQIACQMAFTSIGCAKESILVAVTVNLSC